MPTDQWYSLYTFSVPVLVNYRIPLLDNWALRFGVGPYGEYILGGRTQKGWNIVKNQGFEMRVTAGVKAEVAFEMGCLVLGLGYKCSFLDNNYISDMQTFSLGVGYRF